MMGIIESVTNLFQVQIQFIPSIIFMHIIWVLVHLKGLQLSSNDKLQSHGASKACLEVVDREIQKGMDPFSEVKMECFQTKFYKEHLHMWCERSSLSHQLLLIC